MAELWNEKIKKLGKCSLSSINRLLIVSEISGTYAPQVNNFWAFSKHPSNYNWF